MNYNDEKVLVWKSRVKMKRDEVTFVSTRGHQDFIENHTTKEQTRTLLQKGQALSLLF